MTKTIPLTKGHVAIVDDADHEWLSRWKWTADVSKIAVYARRNDKGRKVYMHRLIVNAQSGQYVDHENHDGLDNRRANLRLCTQSQNCGNARKKRGSSQYKGVHWYKAYGRWQAQIRVNYRNRFLGYYFTEEEAARAYDRAAREMFGEYALTNFSD